MRLLNKVAIVTGGGSGIGRAICERFADEKARVVAVDKSRSRAEETATLIGADAALGLEADVTKDAEIESTVMRTVEAFGRVDILVNNAAIAVGDDILTMDEATWDLNLSVVLKSVFLCSRAVLPKLIQQRSGSIINIASVNGLMGLSEEGYSAAKAGVINLTQNMAIKYGQYNVRSNVICPGTVQTPIWQERVEQDPHIFDKLAQWYPLGRVGQPVDVANAALFLASEEAAWITGTVLTVDGGLTAGSFRMGRALEAAEDS